MVVYLRKSIHSLLSVFKKKAGPKGNEDQKRLAVHYRASQHYQENVFIEASRPQYLEDLHSEAQEGLKIQQQQENRNGANIPDDESIATSETLCVEQDISSPESRSNTRSPDQTSDVLAQQTLTHKGSTFKPSSPVKRLDVSKKRVRRTTIMGIPQQVHKELAQTRGSTFQPLGSTLLPSEGNQDQSSVVIIPTVDGGTPAAKKEGARVHLSELETSRQNERMRRTTEEVHQDDQPINHQSFDSQLCRTSNLRPKSVAVPGMPSSFSISPSILNFLHEPQGPVMSISPQATYLSTIIPNAVLPASIEVIEIDRCCSRTCGSSVNHDGGVCPVSKNSLTSGGPSVSPTVSRSSDGKCSQPDTSHDSALLPLSTSGSNWSESQSSQTITAKSSGLSGQENQALPCENQDFSQPHSPVDVADSPGSNGGRAAEIGSECGSKEPTVPEEPGNPKRSFTRSLSIMKTKQPPAPPRRTNSLHQNKIRKNSRIVVDINISNTAPPEVKSSSDNTVTEDTAKTETTENAVMLPTASTSVDFSSEDSSSTSLKPVLTSSNQAGEPPLESSSSSSQKTPVDGEKFERTMSPSSGYSSQSGTPTLSPKGICPPSPEDQKRKPTKPERSTSGASSSGASPSSSLTSLSSGTSELVNPEASMNSLHVPQGSSVPAKEPECTNSLSSFRGDIKALLNIPPPPKVRAPSAPPPETWAHNRHSVDLLCGPGPNVNRLAQILAPEQNAEEAESMRTGQVMHEKQTNTEKHVLEVSMNEANLDSLFVRNLQGAIEEQVRGECPGTGKTDDDTQAGKACSPVLKEPQTWKEPPPVMKKPLVMPHRQETELSFVVHCGEGSSSVSTASSQSPVTASAQTRDKDNKPTVQTLSVELPNISKTSPPPTPPPPYHPTPPALRKTPPFVPTKESQELQDEFSVVDSSWPPPPPPLEAESVFDGGEEVDFPPPPPPVLTDVVADVLDSVLRPAVTDSKPQAAVEPLQSAREVFSPSARDNSSPTAAVSPPLLEFPLASPITKAGSTESVPSVSHELMSPKTENQTPTDTQVNSQQWDESAVSAVPQPPTDNLTHGVIFRRQSSGGYRDTRSKELLSRHKSIPIPKEDANIPLVTPSLLQMVRLRSVSVTEDQVQAPSEDKSTTAGSPIQEKCTGPQNIPQKPIRKSLSLKSSPPAVSVSSVTASSPSTRLQEAVRMKTAAMSSNDGLSCKVRSPPSFCVSERSIQALKSPEGCDMRKSTASTASFIFSKSTKKVIIETSTEPQAVLTQSLAAEFKQKSGHPKAFLNGSIKGDKVPPPVAKKPAHGSTSPSHIPNSCTEKVQIRVEGNGGAGRVLSPTGASLPATTTRVTADTIETLF
ncbi:uncharacterized protein KIAA1522 homolog isoform X3 [Oryzias melastigma]|uniref:uncharacterized protein KIAA1522 homolog isoform X3 n=1 Tax=Oryzias melastigma TaxID=30732 RepID=UPI000CF80FC0|nr:uncharacterized protein KIAA1522 homolog isoform X3 [Oryzias melastigma]